MSTRSDDATALLALVNRLVDVGAEPLRASEAWRLLAVVPAPGSLLGADGPSLAQVAAASGLDHARLTRLLDTGIGLAMRLESLAERGIRALTVFEADYPQRLRARLGDGAPPVLYVAGEATLLSSAGVAVVGSRDADPPAVEVAAAIGRLVSDASYTLVSGASEGVEAAAVGAALEAGGTVVAVLADSLQTALGRRAERTAVIEGRACLCTPYRPDAAYTDLAARGRQRIVHALARAAVVVACGDGSGATWAGATEALRRAPGEVTVWTGPGAGAGNTVLAAAGARPVDRVDDAIGGHRG